MIKFNESAKVKICPGKTCTFVKEKVSMEGVFCITVILFFKTNGLNFSTVHASPYTGNTLHIFGIIKLHTYKDEDCSHTMNDINEQSYGR